MDRNSTSAFGPLLPSICDLATPVTSGKVFVSYRQRTYCHDLKDKISAFRKHRN